MDTSGRRQVAIVGGGAAGAIVACELASIDAPLDVDVFEPSGDVGPGLAYSTTDPLHVVNVPAAKLSAVASDPAHLVRWLGSRGEDARDEAFPQRRLYGEYLRELFAERVAGARATRVRVVPELVERHDDLTSYDAVVLALGNVQAPPAVALANEPRCFASPWIGGALDGADLGDGDRVLVIGTGLTAVDAVLSLAAAAPGVELHMVSRNGKLPYAHLDGPLRAPAPNDAMPRDAATLDELCVGWERHLADAEAAGYDWRDAVDGLRPRTQQLWRALRVEEQQRFLREHRRWWEARRNRSAPAIGVQLAALRTSGRLYVRAIQPGDIDDPAWARIVAATGPTSDLRRTTNPLLRDLIEHGVAAPDPHLLGIRTDPDGALLDAEGRASDRLSTLGWLRRGELWETLAIPEIREQARVIARRLSP